MAIRVALASRVNLFAMRVVCQQPGYFPWLGYCEQLAQADVFVYLDHVQWIRQGRQHRTRLASPSTPPFWLTIPVLGHGHREKSFRDMQVDPTQAWARKHWETLRALYGKARFFRTQLEPLVRPFYEQAQAQRFLLDLCLGSQQRLLEPLGIRTRITFSSQLSATGKKTDLLLGLCQQLGATEYYSALGSARYLDISRFRAQGIPVRWQHFRHSALDPLRPCDYSVLDWLAHCEWGEIRARLGTNHSQPER